MRLDPSGRRAPRADIASAHLQTPGTSGASWREFGRFVPYVPRVLGVAIVNSSPPKLDVTTCATATQTTVTFDHAVTAYPTDGSWQFVRIVHTSGNVYVCLNGARKTSFAVAPGRLQSTFSPHVGSDVRWLPQGAFFDGELDDVRVLTGALPCD